MTGKPLQINIKEVLASKSPKLARLGFLVSYLRRIVHQDEINSFLHDFAGLPPVEFARATLDRMGIAYHAEGMEKLDPRGRYIFASNHPFGSIDGLMLADEVYRYFGNVRLVVNDLLMNLDPLKGVFVPVNKHGRQSSEYARLHGDAFESEIPIVTFPAGLCSRRTRGVVHDLPWKPNFVKRAVASRRDVVPVFFEGELSNFFYRLSNLRTKLGIKANVEMLYLADEMFKLRGRHFTMRIGDPIPWRELEDGRSPAQWARIVCDRAYALKPAAK